MTAATTTGLRMAIFKIVYAQSELLRLQATGQPCAATRRKHAQAVARLCAAQAKRHRLEQELPPEVVAGVWHAYADMLALASTQQKQLHSSSPPEWLSRPPTPAEAQADEAALQALRARQDARSSAEAGLAGRSRTVWRAQGGSTFHNRGCDVLQRLEVAVELAVRDAVTQGLRPCRLCSPGQV